MREKELVKAVGSFMQNPIVPLPADLTALVGAYIDNYDQCEEGTGDRLNEELLAIHQRHVQGNPRKCAAFLALLRLLRPAIRTPTRMLIWWDRLIEPVLGSLSQEEGAVNEVLKNINELVQSEEDDISASEDAGFNPFAQRLLDRWLKDSNSLDKSSVACFKESLVRRTLLVMARKEAKNFMMALDGYVVKRDYRIQALHLLCEFIKSQPPHLHVVTQTPLFNHLLQSLQNDNSTPTVAMALVALTMLMPYIPSFLVTCLPTLFNIYARLLFWDKERLFDPEHAGYDEVVQPKTETTWEKCLYDADLDGVSIPHLPSYFTMLYGLYPINFMDYIRKPQRYLRHANDAEDIDVQSTEIRVRSEKYRQFHILHANFYYFTVDSEKSDLSRFVKSGADEVLASCLALSLLEWPAFDGLQEPMSGTHSPLAEQDTAREEKASRPKSDSTTRHQSVTSRSSRHSMSESLASQPPRPPSQLQDMMHSNKTITSGHHQSLANDSVLSLTLSHQEVPQLLVGSLDAAAQIRQLRRQNVLLQNDLQFEIYVKQQHMTHIGELRRNLVKEAATEAETQNLVMGNRNMRHRLEEAKKAELQIRNESDRRRMMAKKWEIDFSNKLKTLREEQRKWTSTEKTLRHDLDMTRADCERLRVLVAAAEAKLLKAEHDRQAIEISTQEIERLKADVARLSLAEREYQGKEVEMAEAIEGATLAEARANELLKEVKIREQEMQQERHLLESQVIELTAKLSEANKATQDRRSLEMRATYDRALDESRAKQAELQSQCKALEQKNAALQLTLLELESDMEAKQSRRRDVSVSPETSSGLGEDSFELMSYNTTAPLEPLSSSFESGNRRATTPVSAGPSETAGASKSRGASPTALRKERKKKEEKLGKKERRVPVIRGIRAFGSGSSYSY